MRVLFWVWFTFVLLACHSGGSVSVERNARLNGGKEFAGSCQIVQRPIVLRVGYCAEIYSDQPEVWRETCEMQEGVWISSPCNAYENLSGRCFLRKESGLEVIYAVSQLAGQACVDAGGFWQSGF